MKGLQTTLFILFTMVLSVQAIRHVHLYVYGYEDSILAPYEEFSGIQKEIRLEASTDELLAEYGETQNEIRQLRDANPTKELYEMRQKYSELYWRNDALAKELRQRQNRQKELRDIWVFSVAGYILIVLGTLLYARGSERIGMSLLVPGFLELSWWSAPSFTLGGAAQEYESLLVNKIILTVIAFVLIYSLWLLARRKRSVLDTSED